MNFSRLARTRSTIASLLVVALLVPAGFIAPADAAPAPAALPKAPQLSLLRGLPAPSNFGLMLNASTMRAPVGSAITFSGLVTSAASSNQLVIDYGDNTPQTVAIVENAAATNQAFSYAHAYAAPGTYTVQFLRKDAQSGDVTRTGVARTVTIVDAARPTAQISIAAGPRSTTTNGTITYSGIENVPQSARNAYVLDTGDGRKIALVAAGAAASGRAYSVPVVYGAPGSYIAQTQAFDVATNTYTTLSSAMIAVAAPTATLRAVPSLVTLGEILTLSGTIGAAPAAGSAYAVDYGDGSPIAAILSPGGAPTATFSFQHAYAAAGRYAPAIVVTGRRTLAASAQRAATTSVVVAAAGPPVPNAAVSNPAGSLTITPATTTLGTSQAFAVTLANANRNATYEIDFGDNTTSSAIGFVPATTANHTYAQSGTYAAKFVQVVPMNGVAVTTTLATANATVNAAATAIPSTIPTAAPSTIPTAAPSTVPTAAPSTVPTAAPSTVPTAAPSTVPTAAPSTIPTAAPATAPPPPTATVNVNPPSATLGSVSTVSGTLTEAYGNYSTYVLDYGDGVTTPLPLSTNAAPSTAQFSNVHTYGAAGQYTIRVLQKTNTGAQTFVLATTTTTIFIPGASPSPIQSSNPTSSNAPLPTATPYTSPTPYASPPPFRSPMPTPVATMTPTPTPTPTPAPIVTATPTPVPTVAPGPASVTVSPGTIYSGNATIVTITVPPSRARTFAVANLQIAYGDGTTQQFPYGSTQLSHTYRSPSTTTETLVLTSVSAPTAPLATANIAIVVPSAALILGNPQGLAGSTTSVSIATDAIAGQTGPTLSLDWGDGTPKSTGLTFANQSLTHYYALPGNYMLTLGDAATPTLSTAALSVVAQTQSLSVPLTPVPLGQAAQIGVTLSPPPGFPVTPVTLNFGDGSSSIVMASGIYPHVYAKAQVYPVRLVNSTSGGTLVAKAVVVATVAPRVPIGRIYSSSFTISPVLAGAQTHIIFTWNTATPLLSTFADPIQGYVDLLDAKGNLVRRSDVFQIDPDDFTGPGIHTSSIPYDTPVDARGTYQTRVVLFSSAGGTIGVGPTSTLIIIGGPDPEFKINGVFHDTGAVEIGPHAGQPGVTFDAGVSLGFLSPTFGGTVTGLYDPISRKSDPLINLKSADNSSQFKGPDATPIPAASGDTLARNAFAVPNPLASVTPPATISTLPGPPSAAPVVPFAPGMPSAPAPPEPITQPAGAAIYTAPSPTASPGISPIQSVVPISAAGAANAGPTRPAPTTPATPPPGPPLVSSIVAPTSVAPTVMVSGAASPIEPAPARVVISQPVQQVPTVAITSVPHTYTDFYGRSQASLPDSLGGGATIRGVDVGDTVGDTTYHVGYGYTQLASGTTPAQRGEIFEINRTLGADGFARVSYFGRQDDVPNNPDPSVSPAVAMPGLSGPLETGSQAIQLSLPTFDGLKLSFAGALSAAQTLEGNNNLIEDAADKFALTYAHGSDNFAFDYHNAGPQFAVGSGPGATSDRVGFSSGANLALGPVVSSALSYSRDEARSAFSRQSTAGLTFNFALPQSSTLSLGLTRGTQLANQADTRSDSETFAYGRHIGIGTLALNGSVSSVADFLNATNDAITRTGSVQYAVQSNGHALGIGFTATRVSTFPAVPVPVPVVTTDPTIGGPDAATAPGGVGSTAVTPVTGSGGNAQFGESLTYGFPFGGKVVNGAIVHGLELQLSATNTNARSDASGAYDEALSGILSYHLSAHVAVGLRTEYTWHGDIVPENRHKASAIRLRLDLTQ